MAWTKRVAEQPYWWLTMNACTPIPLRPDPSALPAMLSLSRAAIIVAKAVNELVR